MVKLGLGVRIRVRDVADSLLGRYLDNSVVSVLRKSN